MIQYPKNTKAISINNRSVNNEKVQNSPGERRNYVDALRVLATGAVVLLHTITGVMDHTDMSQFQSQNTLFLVLMDWLTWCVPIFVMISGILFLDSNRFFTMKDMVDKYLKRIIFALFLFGVPYAMLEIAMMEKVIEGQVLWRSILRVCMGKSWSHMWYLYLVLFLYLLTPLTKKVIGRISKCTIVCFMAFLYAFSSLFPFFRIAFQWKVPVLPDFCIYYFYFLAGYLFSEKEKKGVLGKGIGKYAYPLIMFGILVGTFASRVVGTYHVQMAYNYPITVIGSLCLMNVAMMWKELWQKNPTFWKKAGKYCFSIYLVHPFFLNLMYKFLGLSPLQFPIGSGIAFFWCVTMLLTIWAVYLLKMIPFLKENVL